VLVIISLRAVSNLSECTVDRGDHTRNDAGRAAHHAQSTRIASGETAAPLSVSPAVADHHQSAMSAGDGAIDAIVSVEVSVPNRG
jgi:hypothetical protein